VAGEVTGRSRGAGPGGQQDRPARVPRAGRPQVHARRDGGAVRRPVRAADLWIRPASGGKGCSWSCRIGCRWSAEFTVRNRAAGWWCRAWHPARSAN